MQDSQSIFRLANCKNNRFTFFPFELPQPDDLSTINGGFLTISQMWLNLIYYLMKFINYTSVDLKNKIINQIQWYFKFIPEKLYCILFRK